MATYSFMCQLQVQEFYFCGIQSETAEGLNHIQMYQLRILLRRANNR